MSVYAVSDLHGHLKLYQAIKNFLKPEDKVICLGDCGDRGPQPWETIKAVAADPQWKYLMGNHEHMLAGAMCEFLAHPRRIEVRAMYPGAGSMTELVKMNGGSKTLQGWKMDGADPKWIDFLLSLDRTAQYKNVLLSHAGYTPGQILEDDELLWGRSHLYDDWPDNHPDTIVVHGHTTCVHLAQIADMKWTPNDGAIHYEDGHKIDIDMCTVLTHCALLLDLDTFDEHIFQSDEDE